jgi:predicted DsbA family dithiol-disulfide isomerase
MDGEKAQAILSSNTYAQEVRAREQFFQQAGIHSVPAVIINDRHLISGGQPVEVFENALRKIAAGAV